MSVGDADDVMTSLEANFLHPDRIEFRLGHALGLDACCVVRGGDEVYVLSRDELVLALPVASVGVQNMAVAGGVLADIDVLFQAPDAVYRGAGVQRRIFVFAAWACSAYLFLRRRG